MNNKYAHEIEAAEYCQECDVRGDTIDQLEKALGEAILVAEEANKDCKEMLSRGEQLERDKAELVKTVGFLWGEECAHSEEQLTEHMNKIMAKYFPPLKESENE